ncbi:hypothetical protein OHT20_05545 [Streptomyces caniferus]|uniref:Uncharacterized protein n=1 Tax=Streptomyces caniferus TaxID=285557 RepID=A0A640S6E2_9ACTN|nr:hypothetical protein [Streptomyces caniferus]GFE06617.1 hypothetical protein Scani_28850 [Streptomyces caniferus]
MAFLGYGRDRENDHGWRNVNYRGTINVEVDTELVKLDPAGFRPLRSRRERP